MRPDTGEAPPTEVRYAQVHEDPLLELRLVERLLARRPRPLRVAIVASGGCTALTLLGHGAIARVEAIDQHPAQLHLTEFKRQAIAHLPLDDQLRLLAAVSGGSGPERLALYQGLRPHLPELTRAYWDAHTAEVAFGLNRVGHFERRLHAVAAGLARQGLDPLLHPRDVVLDARFREAFLAGFSAEPGLAEHLSEAFSRGMWRFLPEDNYFLHQAWADAYAPGRLPPHWQADTQDAMRRLGLDRLGLHTGDFTETVALLAADAPFDLVVTSHLTDRLPIAGLHGFMDAMRRALAPGGALLARRLRGDYGLEAVMSEHLAVDGPLGKELWLADRAFLCSEVAVGFRAFEER